MIRNFQETSMYFALTFIVLGVKVFPLTFDFVIYPLNNKIFDGKSPDISMKWSYIYYMHSNFLLTFHIYISFFFFFLTLK